MHRYEPLCIRNGKVVTAEEELQIAFSVMARMERSDSNGTSSTRLDRRGDVLIEGNHRGFAPASPPPHRDVIDATGMYVLPGGIDCHTHLDMPFGGTTSADDFETGTRAAAFGGTTTIVDFAIQSRGTRMRDALDTWWKKAEGKACIDYGLHMIVTDLGDCRPGGHGRTGATRASPASSSSWLIRTS